MARSPAPSPPPRSARKRTRPRPGLFRALGRREPPASVWVEGAAFTLCEVLKHDSWGATALYAHGDGRRIVCKFGRQQPILGIPMRGVGRRLAARERWFLQRLGDLPGVPRACGPVRLEPGGRALDFALAREYVPGAPLRRRHAVTEPFFARLEALLRTMHRRGIAYVDLDKRENIVVDPQGRPWLVDYQICWRTPPGPWGRLWPVRRVHSLLCRSDHYHLDKHRLRRQRDLSPARERRLRERRRPWFLRAHRALVSGPFRWLRRRILVWSSVRSGYGSPASEVFPEDMVRRRRAARAARRRASAQPER